LKDAGLKRITISLDALDDRHFRSMADVDVPVERVLAAIDAAVEAGLAPVKLDIVVLRGMNDGDIVDIAARYRGTAIIPRFIEFMDVGNTNGWRIDRVVTGAEIRDRIAARWPLEPAESNYFGEVARRWRYADGLGEIGIITSVTQPFCSSCTRARLSAEGELYTCLFGSSGYDLRSLIRGGASDEEITSAIASVWRVRNDRYSEIRSNDTVGLKKVEMSRIGG
jgi:cyclic pyranopterin phosphate synthase